MIRRQHSFPTRAVVVLAVAAGALVALASKASAQGGALPRLTTAAPAPMSLGGMTAAPATPSMAAPRGGYIASPRTDAPRARSSPRGELPRLRTARPGYGAYGSYGPSSGVGGGSRYTRAPYTRWGVGTGCKYGCVSGGYGGRFAKWYIIGYPLFGAPTFYPYYDYGYSTHSEVVTDAYTPEAPRPTSKLIVIGAGTTGGTDALTVESIADSVRLTWLANGRAAREVKLFVADSAKRELATRSTNPSTPTATFEVATLSAPVAFAGVTVVFPDGVTSTTFVPYRRVAIPSGPR